MGGSDRERELVETLEATGYAAMRCPASGGATTRELPDVLCGRKQGWRDHLEPISHAARLNRSHTAVQKGANNIGTLSDSYAIELKSGKSTTLYVQPEEVEALESFAERFGATPLLAARFTSRASPVRIYGVRPMNARKTDSGTYGLPQTDIEERASVIWTPPVGDREADVVWCG